tara:strand:+ start:269 stop:505 length:237 start_codon:yes stop_codon:yes gene_type:complete
MSGKASASKVMKSVGTDELQHKVETTKEIKKYKPKSIFEDYSKEVEKKKKVKIAKAKAGQMTQDKAERMLQTGRWADK